MEVNMCRTGRKEKTVLAFNVKMPENMRDRKEKTDLFLFLEFPVRTPGTPASFVGTAGLGLFSV